MKIINKHSIIFKKQKQLKDNYFFIQLFLFTCKERFGLDIKIVSNKNYFD